jgi:hypothetical protein
MGEQDLPADWLRTSLFDYYSPEIQQARQISAQIEDAYRKGDFETAEKLDAQLEIFYETLENQLADHLDDADPERDSGGLSEDEDQRMGGMGTPSAVEQIRDTYGRYLRGDFSDGRTGDPDLTPEQALASRIRSSLAGEGFTPTGDDLNLTGDSYNRSGWKEANQRVIDATDEQIIAMAKDLFDAHQQTKARVQQNQGTTRDVVQMLARLGAPVAAMAPIMAASRAQAGQPPQVMDERQFLRSLATNDPRLPQFAFADGKQLPGYMTSGVNSGQIPADPNRQDPRALVLPGGQPADRGDDLPFARWSWKPQDGETVFPENILGTDLSMEVSPEERLSWYSSDKYLSPQHRQYIDNATAFLDQPLAPKDAAKRIGVNSDGDGDLTPRQLLDAIPVTVEYLEASREYDNDKSPENRERLDAATKPYLMYLAGQAQPFSETPAGQAVWAELTGQVYDRNAHPYAGNYARAMINAIGAGRTGRISENDPSMSQSEFDALQAKYGDEANRMLAPGGVTNARREAAFDFFSAMQEGEHYNPHIDTPSMAMTVARDFNNTPGGNDRWQTLMQPDAYLGRMQMANERLVNANEAFAQAEKNPEKPFVLQAQNTNRLDPASFGGLFNLAGNSSWGYGRNVQNPYQPVFGEMLTRSQLPDRGLEFFQDIGNRVYRENPIRPDAQAPEDFRKTREFALERRQATGAYPLTFGPRVADAWNDATPDFFPRMSRTYPSPLTAPLYQIGPAVAQSAAQTGMIAVPMISGVAKATTGLGALASAAGTLGKGYLGEALLDENMEAAIGDPQGIPGMATPMEGNSWMSPIRPGGEVPGTGLKRTPQEYQRMLNPENREDWEQGVKETNERRLNQVRGQYQQWDKMTPRRDATTSAMPFGPLLLN